MEDKIEDITYERMRAEYSAGMVIKTSILHPNNAVSELLSLHLSTEYFLDQLIQVYLRKGDVITRNQRVVFHFKLLIVESFDIIDNCVIVSLKGLNKVRNKCAHQLNYNIKPSDIDRIGQPLGKLYEDAKKKHKESLLRFLLIYLITVLEAKAEKTKGDSLM